VPNIQFSVPAEEYVKLLERGNRLGLSEHQFAKAVVQLAADTTSDEDILETRRRQASARATSLRERLTRVRPIG